jgi:hypothetical protein
MKDTQLHEVYTPLLANIVVEVITPSQTKSGLTLSPSMKEEFRKKMNPALRVIAVGKDVTTIKVNDWIIPRHDARPSQLLLLYNDPDVSSICHVQMHETEVMGIVDSKFALAKQSEMTTSTVSQTIIN